MSHRLQTKEFVLGVTWVLLAVASYELLNHIPRGTLISLTTSFDAAIPVIPVFVVPYLSFIPLVFVVLPWLTASQPKVFSSYTLSLFITQMILNVLYLLVPATVTRPQLIGNDVFSNLLRDLVWKLDEPVNTFPSNHVAFSVIAILAIAKLGKRTWLTTGLQVWLGLVCLSTLFVHQHVIADVVAGVIIGSTVFLVAFGKPKPSDHSGD